MSRSIVPAALALVAALAVGASACAAQVSVSGDAGAEMRKVGYTDADLHTPDGAKSLAFRLWLAAGSVCGGDNALVRSGAHFVQCKQAAVERAIANLNAPLVADALGGLAPTTMAHR